MARPSFLALEVTLLADFFVILERMKLTNMASLEKTIQGENMRSKSQQPCSFLALEVTLKADCFVI